MGCDIHCYIEYEKGQDWLSFGGRINPGRYYAIFETMAGVRGDQSKALIQPRGIPENIGFTAKHDNLLYITETECEGYVSKAKADRYVRECGSKYIRDSQGVNRWVTHPDWHTHSWLTTDEFEKAIKTAKCFGDAPEYSAIIAAMRSFDIQGYPARLVFWFDN